MHYSFQEFNTSPSKHPLQKGDIILIRDGQKEIHFLMFYKNHNNDVNNKSQEFFSKKDTTFLKWDYIIECEDIKILSKTITKLTDNILFSWEKWLGR